MKKVLVIDDDEGILDAMALVLESSYTVDTVSKGEEVYKKINAFQPDLILLDVLMSGSDGREICKRLKGDDKTKQIPIIMMSAHPTAKKSALEIGG